MVSLCGGGCRDLFWELGVLGVLGNIGGHLGYGLRDFTFQHIGFLNIF